MAEAVMDERLPWHQAQWRRLQQQRQSGRLPHALLLTGPAGLGKWRFAQRLARALLCAAPDAEGDACGHCRSCRLFQAGSHPDCSTVRPAEESKIIKVDQIRELCAFLNYTAQYGGYKIALLAPADRLNSNAANSLLKTLEEPPGDSLLALATAQPARLPATVRSRCQIVRFRPPALEIAAPWLAARVRSDLKPAVLLSLAGGAPLAALVYADEERWRRRLELFERYGQVLMGRLDPIQAVEKWVQGDLTENLRWLVGWHTDMIRLKMNSKPPHLDNPDLGATLGRWAEQWSLRVLFERLDATVRIYTLYATTQINAQLLLETFLSDGADVKDFDVSGMHARGD